ncbi:hypothetical protein ACLB2K_002521 [Fragaria x ananassa]
MPNPSSNFEEWLVSIFQNRQPLTIEDSLLVCWQIWKARNNVIFRSAEVTHPTIMHAAAATGSAYRLINKKTLSCSPTNLETIRWIPLTPNWFKLNFDGSVFPTSSAAGFVIRDSAGSLIVSGARRLHNSFVPLAECMALKDELLVAKRRNCNQIEVEGDFSLIINCVKVSCAIPWKFKSLIRDVLALADSFVNITFSYTYR